MRDVRNVEVVGSSPITSTYEAAGRVAETALFVDELPPLRVLRAIRCSFQLLTARRRQLPGIPGSSWSPRSSNSSPAPATRSVTVRVTSTSPGAAR